MSSINSWASGIVASVILATIIEMILPEGKNKKYIKTIIGIFVLFTIISPVISKFSSENFDLGSVLASSDVYKYNEISLNSLDTNEAILSTYEEKLKDEITQKLENKGYGVNSIEIDVGDLENEYGQINEIILSVSEMENKSDVKLINEIKIGNDVQEKNDVIEADLIDLKEYLADEYQIDVNNVIISYGS